MNQKAICALVVMMTTNVFANQVWIEKDSRGKDSKLHITLDEPSTVQKMQQAFPNGFFQTSISPIDQSLTVSCDAARCEVEYSDENRNYRQNFDEGLRAFDLNRDIAITFFQAFNVDAVHRSGFERKTLSSIDPDMDAYFRPRMTLTCNKSLEQRRGFSGPYCFLQYSIIDLLE